VERLPRKPERQDQGMSDRGSTGLCASARVVLRVGN